MRIKEVELSQEKVGLGSSAQGPGMSQALKPDLLAPRGRKPFGDIQVQAMTPFTPVFTDNSSYSSVWASSHIN